MAVTDQSGEEASAAQDDAPAHRPVMRHSLARSQDAYDRFAAAVDAPLMVVTLLWLPILIIPLIRPVHGATAETFAAIDYTIWALFAVEYLVKLYLAPSRGKYFRTHILDLI